ncbi:MAG: substrate-binding domain-containing protein [Clostridiales bacterium]|nr:substrate-binding domain-containing protein [Clostridiales bacterium]
MKKIFGFALIALMAASMLTGCGGGTLGSLDADENNDSSGQGFDSAREITVVSREDGSGTRSAFIELLGIEVKEADGSKKDMTTKEAVTAGRTDIMLTNVASDPYAIGYVSMGSLDSSVKALSINGVAPNAGNVKNGSYAVSRPFNIATQGDPVGLAKDFIDFIMSAEGQEVISHGYIKIDESAPAFAGSKPSGRLVIAGSSSVSPIMEKLAEAYMEINEGADLQLQTSDSTTGMNSTIDGICDIGMASRDLKDTELATLTGLTIAMDGIAVIVNNANPMTDIGSDAVRQIFIGEVTTWE